MLREQISAFLWKFSREVVMLEAVQGHVSLHTVPAQGGGSTIMRGTEAQIQQKQRLAMGTEKDRGRKRGQMTSFES